MEPPEFTLNWCPTAVFCPEVETPYDHTEVFYIGTPRPHVKVHHADGVDEVPLEGIDDDEAAGTSAVPWLKNATDEGRLSGSESGDEAVGHSSRLTYDDSWARGFDEAFSDALRNLPEREAKHPDELITVRIVDAGAIFGGFAGFRHMYVRVRRPRG